MRRMIVGDEMTVEMLAKRENTWTMWTKDFLRRRVARSEKLQALIGRSMFKACVDLGENASSS